MATKRNINYINKEFSEFRSQLINYSQTYFPTTYTDFTDSSPGMMFIEQAAYVSDVLSFYLDNQVQENFMQYVRQSDNLYDLAYMYGYKPKVTGLAETTMEFFQQLPSIQVGDVFQPDYNYCVNIPSNTVITTQTASPISFTIEDPVNFSVSSSNDPTEVSVAQMNDSQPLYYLLRKTRKGFSGKINTESFSFSAPQEFQTITLSSPNIAGIIDVIDSEGNKWYEVDYLAQDLVYDSLRNTNINSPKTSEDTDTPFLLQTKNVQNRFATRFLSSTQLQIQFGSGNPLNTTEDVIPNSMNVGLGLPFEQNKLTAAYSPTNFIFTNTYGVSPTNTTLTIRYYTGGGVVSNVLSNSVNLLNKNDITFNTRRLNSNTSNYIFNTIAANNVVAASGGQDGDTIEEIRQNSISQFSTQMRNVTRDDYLVRALSMPSKYGVVSKALTQKPNAESSNTTLELYVLTNDLNNKLTISSNSLKENLRTYINQYRMIGDTISIKDAFIINFGIQFEIITYPNFNNNEVTERCISSLQDYFQIDKWQINQPIILSSLFVLLDSLEGVQTVRTITVENIAGTLSGYSPWAYDMDGANQNGTIFPSLDPSIFELKYPNTDIKGRVVNI
jgi:hypothetical protein